MYVNTVEFQGKLWFCSNFFPSSIEVDGVSYRTMEHAFQASKTLDPKLREHIRKQVKAAHAKKEGRKVPLRSGWDEMKVQVMRDLVRQKFNFHQSLKERLLATGDRHLEEKNTWGDVFWGTYDGVGENWLGRILMEIREELRAAKVATPR